MAERPPIPAADPLEEEDLVPMDETSVDPEWGALTDWDPVEWGSYVLFRVLPGQAAAADEWYAAVYEQVAPVVDSASAKAIYRLTQIGEDNRQGCVVVWGNEADAGGFLTTPGYRALLASLDDFADITEPVEAFRLVLEFVHGGGMPIENEVYGVLQQWHLRVDRSQGFSINRADWLRTVDQEAGGNFQIGILGASLNHDSHRIVAAGFSVNAPPEDIDTALKQDAPKAYDGEAKRLWATGPARTDWKVQRVLAPPAQQ